MIKPRLRRRLDRIGDKFRRLRDGMRIEEIMNREVRRALVEAVKGLISLRRVKNI